MSNDIIGRVYPDRSSRMIARFEIICPDYPEVESLLPDLVSAEVPGGAGRPYNQKQQD